MRRHVPFQRPPLRSSALGRSAMPIALWVVIPLLLASLAAACGTPTATPTLPPQANDRGSPAQHTSVPEATATSLPPGEQPREGGTLRLLWDDPATLDPHLAQDSTSGNLVGEMFSGLVSLSTSMAVVPDIARTWEISNGGTTYTFHLRDDVRFHDGKPVTAYDFQYSLDRAADPSTGSPVADTYLGDIVGVKEKLAGQADAIRGVRVLDQRTLEVTVDAPKAYILAKLTYPVAFVVDKENIEELGPRWTEHPNGTGPFKLQEFTVGDRLVLERNEDYYRGAPHLEAVEYILRGGSPMAMYENGEIDLLEVGLSVGLEQALGSDNPLLQEVVTAPPEFSLSYIGFNVTMPPFDDPKVRQAMTYAVDKELITSELLGGAIPAAYGILPPGFPGFNADLQGLRHDLARAVTLLEESPYDPKAEEFPRVVLTIPGTGGTMSPYLENTIGVWRQILGIEVEVQQVEWAAFLGDLNRHRLQFFAGLAWQADYPDPQNFLDILFHSQSEGNYTAYANAQADSLLEQARTEQAPQERLALYQEAERLIVEDAPVIPLWFSGERALLIKPYVKGYQPSAMVVPKLKDVWIDQR